MKLLDSLNDGKTQPELPPKEGTAPEPPPEDGDKKDEEKTSEETAEVGEEGQKVSNIHVAAKVGAVNLLLHSRKGHLAIVSVKSEEIMKIDDFFVIKYVRCIFVCDSELCTDVDLKDDDITVRAGYGTIHRFSDVLMYGQKCILLGMDGAISFQGLWLSCTLS